MFLEQVWNNFLTILKMKLLFLFTGQYSSSIILYLYAMLHRGPIIVAVVGYGFFVYIDCSKITDTILHNAMNRVNWYYSNKQWTKYTVADNIEIGNKIKGYQVSVSFTYCIDMYSNFGMVNCMFDMISCNS